MENLVLNHNGIYEVAPKSTSRFLEANTIAIDINEIRDKHIIPVFLKDNEPVISQVDFVEVVSEAAGHHFNLPFKPETRIRVSHPIKGRTYEARNKKAADLLDHEKTVYYERMAFMVEIPGLSSQVGDNPLHLTIGGIKAYNLDNLNSTKGANEHFKVFIGYKNTVCTNLCISTDGAKLDLTCNSLDSLYKAVLEMIQNYDEASHVKKMRSLLDYELSEQQFAQILGKGRLYQFLPKADKKKVPELLLSDTQISRVAEYYYRDENFKRKGKGGISLWNFYNLLTGAIKSSYVDKFLEREVNGFEFTMQIKKALENDSDNFWYLN